MNLAATIELYANRKLHYKTEFQGLPISVENRRGSVRTGNDDDGSVWRTRMAVPYGYIRGTKGMDGDHIDVFVGDNGDASMAYVVHAKRPPTFSAYDEDKVLLGFGSAAEAKKVFLSHYDDERFFGGMDAIPMEQFKRQVLRSKKEPQKLVREKLEKTKKIAANTGEPQVYDGGMAHIEPRQVFHPPSLKNPKRVPVDDPMEKDDEFLDVSKRRDKETIGFRDRLTKKKGSDEKYIGIRTTQVSGFPSVSIGGFG